MLLVGDVTLLYEARETERHNRQAIEGPWEREVDS